MSVDQTTVRRIAKLARIEVSDAAVPALEGELNSILDWIEMLNEVDTDGVAPLTSVVETEMKKRDDVVTDGDKPDDILANAPATEDHFFMVPKVVE
jgi:aspartyl-tRNA(Asn)/glutamyl-tRNA(Gln) amidotransferase subunit C